MGGYWMEIGLERFRENGVRIVEKYIQLTQTR
jgi:hypothetical protein